VWLGVELKESNAHAHTRNAKKQTISHTHENKKMYAYPQAHAKDMLSLYTEKTAYIL